MLQFFKQFGTAASAWEASCIRSTTFFLPLYEMDLCIIEAIYNSIDRRPAVGNVMHETFYFHLENTLAWKSFRRGQVNCIVGADIN